MTITGWIKEHPAEGATVGITAIVVLYLLLHRGGSSSGGVNPTQLLQLNTGASIQESQIAASQNVAQLQAQAYDNQLQASLAANEQNKISEFIGTALQGQTQLAALKIGAGVADNQINAQVTGMSLQSQLAENQLAAEASAEAELQSLEQQSLNNPNQSTSINQLAFLTGQGNLNSYNQYASQTKQQQYGLFGGIANSLINGLFGWL